MRTYTYTLNTRGVSARFPTRWISPGPHDTHHVIPSQEYTVDIYLRQIWNDSRLDWSAIALGDEQKHLVLPPMSIERIWIPDLFFSNEKNSYFHDITVPNKYIRIGRGGEVLYSVR